MELFCLLWKRSRTTKTIAIFFIVIILGEAVAMAATTFRKKRPKSDSVDDDDDDGNAGNGDSNAACNKWCAMNNQVNGTVADLFEDLYKSQFFMKPRNYALEKDAYVSSFHKQEDFSQRLENPTYTWYPGKWENETGGGYPPAALGNTGGGAPRSPDGTGGRRTGNDNGPQNCETDHYFIVPLRILEDGIAYDVTSFDKHFQIIQIGQCTLRSPLSCSQRMRYVWILINDESASELQLRFTQVLYPSHCECFP